MSQEDFVIHNPYLYIADVCGLSERTIRNAFGRKPITFATAARIRKHFNIPSSCFRCVEDNRGRPVKNKKK